MLCSSKTRECTTANCQDIVLFSLQIYTLCSVGIYESLLDIVLVSCSIHMYHVCVHHVDQMAKCVLSTPRAQRARAHVFAARECTHHVLR
jgi:hypothetical protein